MSGRVAGKVAFITGAARGQGRSHAVTLAREGADIIAIDIAADIDTVPFSLATEEDLAETVRQVEYLGRRIVATRADVRDYDALKSALDEGVKTLGRLDIVSANAGIVGFGRAEVLTEAEWQNVIDVNLSGTWHTCKASIPHLIEGGRGGAIVLTSSLVGLRGAPNASHYVTTKHGLVGLMRALALELAPHSIRVNSVHSTQVNTDMIQNAATWDLFLPGASDPSIEQFAAASQTTNLLPVPWVEPHDVSNALLFLVSEDARYITGATLPVDAGANLK